MTKAFSAQISRWISLLLTFVFTANVTLAHVPESSFWAERHRALIKETRRENIQLAGLPAVAGVSAISGLPLGRHAREGGHPVFHPDFQNLFRNMDPRLRHSGMTGKNLLPQISSLMSSLSTAYGSVRKISLPSKNANGKIILHIQDVHQNQEAQVNIGQALHQLMKDQKVGVVALEGAFAPIDLTPFHRYPRQNTIRKVADYLLKDNQISGPVHAALTTTQDLPAGAGLPAIVGVDDRLHYQANVDAYKSSIPVLKEAKAWMEKQTRSLNEEKKKTLNPSLLAFDSLAEAYHSGQMPMGNYLKTLMPLTLPSPLGRGEGLPAEALAKAGVRGNFADITKFLSALDMESALNNSRIEAERSRLLSSLLQKLNKEESQGLVGLTVAYRSGQLRHSDFYQALNTLCQQKKIKLSHFPAMDNYIRYVLLADSLDTEKLFSEVRQIEEDTYASLIKTDAEKNLVRALQHRRLTAKLLDFALTPEEWTEYKKIPPHVLQHRSIIIHGRCSPSHNDHNEVGQWGGKEGMHRVIPYKEIPIHTPPNLPFVRQGEESFLNLASFERFYEEAEARNESMAKNLLAQIQTGPAVLVTGGFHSESLDQKLLDAGFAVITYVPKITKVDASDGSSYLSVFAQEKTPLQKLFEGQKLFLSPAPMPPAPKLALEVSVQSEREDPGSFRRSLTNLSERLASFVTMEKMKKMGNKLDATVTLVKKHLTISIDSSAPDQIDNITIALIGPTLGIGLLSSYAFHQFIHLPLNTSLAWGLAFGTGYFFWRLSQWISNGGVGTFTQFAFAKILMDRHLLRRVNRKASSPTEIFESRSLRSLDLTPILPSQQNKQEAKVEGPPVVSHAGSKPNTFRRLLGSLILSFLILIGHSSIDSLTVTAQNLPSQAINAPSQTSIKENIPSSTNSPAPYAWLYGLGVTNEQTAIRIHNLVLTDNAVRKILQSDPVKFRTFFTLQFVEQIFDSHPLQKKIVMSRKPLEFDQGLLYHGSPDLISALQNGQLNGELYLTRVPHEWAIGPFTQSSPSPAIFVVDTKVFNRLVKTGRAQLNLQRFDDKADVDWVEPYPKLNGLTLEEVREIWIGEDTGALLNRVARAKTAADLPDHEKYIFAFKPAIQQALETGKIKTIPGLNHGDNPEATEYDRIVGHFRNFAILGSFLKTSGSFERIPFFKVVGEPSPFDAVDRKALLEKRFGSITASNGDSQNWRPLAVRIISGVIIVGIFLVLWKWVAKQIIPTTPEKARPQGKLKNDRTQKIGGIHGRSKVKSRAEQPGDTGGNTRGFILTDFAIPFWFVMSSVAIGILAGNQLLKAAPQLGHIQLLQHLLAGLMNHPALASPAGWHSILPPALVSASLLGGLIFYLLRRVIRETSSSNETRDNRSLRSSNMTSSIGGWYLSKMTPYVFVMGMWRKSLSWVINILSSSLDRRASSPFLTPLGVNRTSQPNSLKYRARTTLTFSSIKNLNLSRFPDPVIPFFLHQFGRVVKGGLNVFFGNRGIAFMNLLRGLPGFKKLQNNPNHDTGPGETRLPVTDVGVNRNIFPQFLLHNESFIQRLPSDGQGMGSMGSSFFLRHFPGIILTGLSAIVLAAPFWRQILNHLPHIGGLALLLTVIIAPLILNSLDGFSPKSQASFPRANPPSDSPAEGTNVGRRDLPPSSSARESSALKKLAYEAWLFEQQLEKIADRADQLNRSLIVVENGSNGTIALLPMVQKGREGKYLRLSNGRHIPVWSTQLSSSRSDTHPTSVMPEVFDRVQWNTILHEQPILVVVDASPYPHIPQSLRYGFSNIFLSLNVLAGHPLGTEDTSIISSHHHEFPFHLKSYQDAADYLGFRPRIPSNTQHIYPARFSAEELAKPDLVMPESYRIHFAYPSRRQLPLSLTWGGLSSKLAYAESLTGPSVILYRTNLLPEDFEFDHKAVRYWLDAAPEDFYYDSKLNYFGRFGTDPEQQIPDDALSRKARTFYRQIKQLFRSTNDNPLSPGKDEQRLRNRDQVSTSDIPSAANGPASRKISGFSLMELVISLGIGFSAVAVAAPFWRQILNHLPQIGGIALLLIFVIFSLYSTDSSSPNPKAASTNLNNPLAAKPLELNVGSRDLLPSSFRVSPVMLPLMAILLLAGCATTNQNLKDRDKPRINMEESILKYWPSALEVDAKKSILLDADLQEACGWNQSNKGALEERRRVNKRFSQVLNQNSQARAQALKVLEDRNVTSAERHRILFFFANLENLPPEINNKFISELNGLPEKEKDWLLEHLIYDPESLSSVAKKAAQEGLVRIGCEIASDLRTKLSLSDQEYDLLVEKIKRKLVVGTWREKMQANSEYQINRSHLHLPSVNDVLAHEVGHNILDLAGFSFYRTQDQKELHEFFAELVSLAYHPRECDSVSESPAHSWAYQELRCLGDYSQAMQLKPDFVRLVLIAREKIVHKATPRGVITELFRALGYQGELQTVKSGNLEIYIPRNRGPVSTSDIPSAANGPAGRKIGGFLLRDFSLPLWLGISSFPVGYIAGSLLIHFVPQLGDINLLIHHIAGLLNHPALASPDLWQRILKPALIFASLALGFLFLMSAGDAPTRKPAANTPSSPTENVRWGEIPLSEVRSEDFPVGLLRGMLNQVAVAFSNPEKPDDCVYLIKTQDDEGHTLFMIMTKDSEPVGVLEFIYDQTNQTLKLQNITLFPEKRGASLARTLIAWSYNQGCAKYPDSRHPFQLHKVQNWAIVNLAVDLFSPDDLEVSGSDSVTWHSMNDVPLNFFQGIGPMYLRDDPDVNPQYYGHIQVERSGKGFEIGSTPAGVRVEMNRLEIKAYNIKDGKRLRVIPKAWFDIRVGTRNVRRRVTKGPISNVRHWLGIFLVGLGSNFGGIITDFIIRHFTFTMVESSGKFGRPQGTFDTDVGSRELNSSSTFTTKKHTHMNNGPDSSDWQMDDFKEQALDPWINESPEDRRVREEMEREAIAWRRLDHGSTQAILDVRNQIGALGRGLYGLIAQFEGHEDDMTGPWIAKLTRLQAVAAFYGKFEGTEGEKKSVILERSLRVFERNREIFRGVYADVFRNYKKSDRGQVLDQMKGIASVMESIVDILHSSILFITKSPSSESVSLPRLIEGISSNFPIKVENDLPGSPAVNGNPLAISSALFNLVSNAIHWSQEKATKTGGKPEVTLNVARRGGFARFQIADNGPGIGADLLEFNPKTHRRFLFDLNTSGRKKQINRGTGLGGAEAYYAVEDAGGHLEVQTKMGEGSTFTVWLPLADQNNLGDHTRNATWHDKYFETQPAPSSLLYWFLTSRWIYSIMQTIFRDKADRVIRKIGWFGVFIEGTALVGWLWLGHSDLLANIVLGAVFVVFHALLMIFNIDGNKFRGSPENLVTPALIYSLYSAASPLFHNHPTFGLVPLLIHLIVDFVELKPFDLSRIKELHLTLVTLEAAGGPVNHIIPSFMVWVPGTESGKPHNASGSHGGKRNATSTSSLTRELKDGIKSLIPDLEKIKKNTETLRNRAYERDSSLEYTSKLYRRIHLAAKRSLTRLGRLSEFQRLSDILEEDLIFLFDPRMEQESKNPDEVLFLKGFKSTDLPEKLEFLIGAIQANPDQFVERESTARFRTDQLAHAINQQRKILADLVSFKSTSEPYFSFSLFPPYEKFITQTILALRAIQESIGTAESNRAARNLEIAEKYSLPAEFGNRLDSFAKDMTEGLLRQSDRGYKDGFTPGAISLVASYVASLHSDLSNIRPDTDIIYEIVNLGRLNISETLADANLQAEALVHQLMESTSYTSSAQLVRSVPPETIGVALKWIGNLAEQLKDRKLQKKARTFLAFFIPQFLHEFGHLRFLDRAPAEALANTAGKLSPLAAFKGSQEQLYRFTTILDAALGLPSFSSLGPPQQPSRIKFPTTRPYLRELVIRNLAPLSTPEPQEIGGALVNWEEIHKIAQSMLKRFEKFQFDIFDRVKKQLAGKESTKDILAYNSALTHIYQSVDTLLFANAGQSEIMSCYLVVHAIRTIDDMIEKIHTAKSSPAKGRRLLRKLSKESTQAQKFYAFVKKGYFSYELLEVYVSLAHDLDPLLNKMESLLAPYQKEIQAHAPRKNMRSKGGPTSALDWRNMKAGGIVAMAAWGVKALTMVMMHNWSWSVFTLTGLSLAALVIFSMTWHETWHYGEAASKTRRWKQKLTFENGIHIHGSAGWPGILASGFLTVVSAIFWGIYPEFSWILAPATFVNLIYSFSLSDWNSTVSDFKAEYEVPHPSTHEIIKNLLEVARNRYPILNIKGAQFEGYHFPPYGVCLKWETEWIDSNHQGILSSIALARNKLGGLVAGFVTAEIEGRTYVLQEEVRDLDQVLFEAAARGDNQRINSLLNLYFSWQEEALRRGIFNWDSKFRNFGLVIDENGNEKVVLLDIGTLVDIRTGDLSTSIKNYFANPAELGDFDFINDTIKIHAARHGFFDEESLEATIQALRGQSEGIPLNWAPPEILNHMGRPLDNRNTETWARAIIPFIKPEQSILEITADGTSLIKNDLWREKFKENPHPPLMAAFGSAIKVGETIFSKAYPTFLGWAPEFNRKLEGKYDVIILPLHLVRRIDLYHFINSLKAALKPGGRLVVIGELTISSDERKAIKKQEFLEETANKLLTTIFRKSKSPKTNYYRDDSQAPFFIMTVRKPDFSENGSTNVELNPVQPAYTGKGVLFVSEKTRKRLREVGLFGNLTAGKFAAEFLEDGAAPYAEELLFAALPLTLSHHFPLIGLIIAARALFVAFHSLGEKRSDKFWLDFVLKLSVPISVSLIGLVLPPLHLGILYPFIQNTAIADKTGTFFVVHSALNILTAFVNRSQYMAKRKLKLRKAMFDERFNPTPSVLEFILNLPDPAEFEKLPPNEQIKYPWQLQDYFAQGGPATLEERRALQHVINYFGPPYTKIPIDKLFSLWIAAPGKVNDLSSISESGRSNFFDARDRETISNIASNPAMLYAFTSGVLSILSGQEAEMKTKESENIPGVVRYMRRKNKEAGYLWHPIIFSDEFDVLDLLDSGLNVYLWDGPRLIQSFMDARPLSVEVIAPLQPSGTPRLRINYSHEDPNLIKFFSKFTAANNEPVSLPDSSRLDLAIFTSNLPKKSRESREAIRARLEHRSEVLNELTFKQTDPTSRKIAALQKLNELAVNEKLVLNGFATVDPESPSIFIETLARTINERRALEMTFKVIVHFRSRTGKKQAELSAKQPDARQARKKFDEWLKSFEFFDRLGMPESALLKMNRPRRDMIKPQEKQFLWLLGSDLFRPLAQILFAPKASTSPKAPNNGATEEEWAIELSNMKALLQYIVELAPLLRRQEDVLRSITGRISDPRNKAAFLYELSLAIFQSAPRFQDIRAPLKALWEKQLGVKIPLRMDDNGQTDEVWEAAVRYKNQVNPPDTLPVAIMDQLFLNISGLHFLKIHRLYREGQLRSSVETIQGIALHIEQPTMMDQFNNRIDQFVADHAQKQLLNAGKGVLFVSEKTRKRLREVGLFGNLTAGKFAAEFLEDGAAPYAEELLFAALPLTLSHHFPLIGFIIAARALFVAFHSLGEKRSDKFRLDFVLKLSVPISVSLIGLVLPPLHLGILYPFIQNTAIADKTATFFVVHSALNILTALVNRRHFMTNRKFRLKKANVDPDSSPEPSITKFNFPPNFSTWEISDQIEWFEDVFIPQRAQTLADDLVVSDPDLEITAEELIDVGLEIIEGLNENWEPEEEEGPFWLVAIQKLNSGFNSHIRMKRQDLAEPEGPLDEAYINKPTHPDDIYTENPEEEDFTEGGEKISSTPNIDQNSGWNRLRADVNAKLSPKRKLTVAQVKKNFWQLNKLEAEIVMARYGIGEPMTTGYDQIIPILTARKIMCHGKPYKKHTLELMMVVVLKKLRGKFIAGKRGAIKLLRNDQSGCSAELEKVLKSLRPLEDNKSKKNKPIRPAGAIGEIPDQGSSRGPLPIIMPLFMFNDYSSLPNGWIIPIIFIAAIVISYLCNTALSLETQGPAGSIVPFRRTARPGTGNPQELLSGMQVSMGLGELSDNPRAVIKGRDVVMTAKDVLKMARLGSIPLLAEANSLTILAAAAPEKKSAERLLARAGVKTPVQLRPDLINDGTLDWIQLIQAIPAHIRARNKDNLLFILSKGYFSSGEEVKLPDEIKRAACLILDEVNEAETAFYSSQIGRVMELMNLAKIAAGQA